MPHTILAQGHVGGHPAGSGQKENQHQLFDSLPVSDLGHFCSCVIEQSTGLHPASRGCWGLSRATLCRDRTWGLAPAVRRRPLLSRLLCTGHTPTSEAAGPQLRSSVPQQPPSFCHSAGQADGVQVSWTMDGGPWGSGRAPPWCCRLCPAPGGGLQVRLLCLLRTSVLALGSQSALRCHRGPVHSGSRLQPHIPTPDCLNSSRDGELPPCEKNSRAAPG